MNNTMRALSVSIVCVPDAWGFEGRQNRPAYDVYVRFEHEETSGLWARYCYEQMARDCAARLMKEGVK